uniref:Uncharacterized protein n=1 Tax=Cannabis sativa TaxID=3483 RepID=A0A803QFD4_CANSA
MILFLSVCLAHVIISLALFIRISHPTVALSCVYGPPYFYAKKNFWAEFMKIGYRFGGPWLILGDTNFVLRESKREGRYVDVEQSQICKNHVKFALDKGLVNGAWPTYSCKLLFALIRRATLIIDLCVSILSLPAGAHDWKTESNIRRSLNESLERKASYWRQRARISWIKDGDRCSKFLFLTTAIRGRRNAIESILNKDNIWITSRDLIGQEFFKRIFSGSVGDQRINCNYLFREKISYEDQEVLLTAPTLEEIRSTLFSMNNHKAPGPDGMSVLFFKHYWESVGDDVCDARLL